MKRIMRFTAIIALMFTAYAARCQQGCWGRQVIDPRQPTSDGQPAPYIQIRVCSATATGTPCSPLTPSTLYYDPAGQQPQSNPITTDGNGNYYFCVTPNTYLVQESPTSGVTYSYQVTTSLGASQAVLLAPSGSQTIVQLPGSALNVTGNMNVSGAFTPGSLAVTGSATVGGNETVAGTVTAAGFSGPLTGNVTGNLTGNVTGNSSTATNASQLLGTTWATAPAVTALSYNNVIQGDAYASPNAAITAAQAAGAGIITFKPSSSDYSCPTGIASGIQIIGAASLAPSILWTQFNDGAFSEFMPPTNPVPQVVFSCPSGITISDVNRIGLFNVVFDMQGTGCFVFKGVSNGRYRIAVQNAPLTCPALSIIDDTANAYNTVDNNFEELYVHGGNSGLSIGRASYSPGQSAVTENHYGFVRILASAQPSGSYTALNFVGGCDSQDFQRVSFWFSTAITLANGVVFNSTSTTQDEDADGLAIYWYDETGQSSIRNGWSIVANPSSNNFIRTGVLGANNAQWLSKPSWSGNTTLEWDNVAPGTQSPMEQITTFAHAVIDAGSTGTPGLYFCKGCSQSLTQTYDAQGAWQIYQGGGSSTSPLYIEKGGTNLWQFAANGVLANDNTSFTVDQSGNTTAVGTVTLNSATAGSSELDFDVAGVKKWTILSGSDGNFRIAPSGVTKFEIDTSGNSYLQGGTTIIYRCLTAGTLRAGQLTSVSADCGSSVDTGLRTP
jgi:hypothetical protein